MLLFEYNNRGYLRNYKFLVRPGSYRAVTFPVLATDPTLPSSRNHNPKYEENGNTMIERKEKRENLYYREREGMSLY